MNREFTSAETLSQAADKFLYFFLGLRKGDIRRRASDLKARHPEESPEQLARRLIAAQTPLSLLGGILLNVPMFLPSIGPALKVLGIAGATTVLMNMHMALVLEIACLFDRDIDDPVRLKEMTAVLAATGLASSTPILFRTFSMKPYYATVTGGMTVSSISRLIGESAILYYSHREKAPATLALPKNIVHPGIDKMPV